MSYMWCLGRIGRDFILSSSCARRVWCHREALGFAWVLLNEGLVQILIYIFRNGVRLTVTTWRLRRIPLPPLCRRRMIHWWMASSSRTTLNTARIPIFIFKLLTRYCGSVFPIPTGICCSTSHLRCNRPRDGNCHHCVDDGAVHGCVENIEGSFQAAVGGCSKSHDALAWRHTWRWVLEVADLVNWLMHGGIGRMLNRFGKDFDTIDNNLAGSLSAMNPSLATFAAAIITVACVVSYSLDDERHWTVFGFVASCSRILDSRFRYRLLLSSASHLVLEHEPRSLSHGVQLSIANILWFVELLEGVVAVRAFSAERQFLDDLQSKLDMTTKVGVSWFLSALHEVCARVLKCGTISGWLLLNLDTLGGLAVVMTTPDTSRLVFLVFAPRVRWRLRWACIGRVASGLLLSLIWGMPPYMF